MKRLLIIILSLVLGLSIFLVSCGVEKEASNPKTVDSKEEAVAKDSKVEEEPEPVKDNSKYTICIDPGHQEKPMLDKEPMYPGGSELKYKVAAGATGVSTGKKEYELTLEVSLKLRDILSKEGYNVVMTRDVNNTTISNIDRAKIGNNANADLVVRVHADSNNSSKVEGSTILHPIGKYTEGIYDNSLKAATIMEEEYRLATGAKSRGLMPRSDMTGFNHSIVPTIIVEMGFMSNPKEDELMASDEYQKKIVNGIYNGIVKYCETINK
ncbi:MAG: N-acetylmuramoyl-L-alanine amidase [Clostridium sp.]